jgi:hypothetical protein
MAPRESRCGRGGFDKLNRHSWQRLPVRGPIPQAVVDEHVNIRPRQTSAAPYEGSVYETEYAGARHPSHFT